MSACEMPLHANLVYEYLTRRAGNGALFEQMPDVSSTRTVSGAYIPHVQFMVVEGANNIEVCDLCCELGAVFECEHCEDEFYFAPTVTRFGYYSVSARDVFGGDHVCESCFESAIDTGTILYCDGCDTYHHEDEGRCRESDDEYVHDYSYKPDPIFTPTLPDTHYTRTPSLWRMHSALSTTPLRDRATREVVQKRALTRYGIEVEFEVRENNRSEIAEFIHEFDPNETAVFAKHDSSLTYGLELNFHPRSLEAWREYLPTMTEFFTGLRDLGARGDVDTAGIHIHANKRGLESPSHLWRILRFMVLNQDRVQGFARRESSWARFDHIDDEALALAFGRDSGEHYDALNVQRETVEFRIFRGSLKGGRVLANVEWIDALTEFTRGMSLADVRTVGLNWGSFVEYVSNSGYSFAGTALAGGSFND
jgi:hypothetical protein